MEFGGGQGMFQSLCRINPPTIVRLHPACLRHLLSIKCTKYIPLVLRNPHRNVRSRQGESSAYACLLPRIRALVRSGDEDGENHVRLDDENTDTDRVDEESPEKPKRMVAKQKRRPMSDETKKKIAAAKKGKLRSEETKQKISLSMTKRRLSLGHRYQISLGRKGKKHSLETRLKIANNVSSTKRMLKRQKLAERAAAAAEEATADIRNSFEHRNLYSDQECSEDNLEAENLLDDMIELEKAVIEVTALRNQLTAWMDAYENKYGGKPDLTETSESHPHVYGRFVRYVALRELVRESSLKLGESPAWT
eukprot:jgi/Picsp_1/2504/NSC_00735-R1_---NA---